MYAATDSSSRNTLHWDEFQGGHNVELMAQIKHQEAANDKAKANLILLDLIVC
jgi:hypothetical protein